MKYKKKPLVVEAIQFDGTNESFSKIIAQFGGQGINKTAAKGGTFGLVLSTTEGVHTVTPDTWVIRGIKGELYPCASDVFEATYDLAGEATATTRSTTATGATTNNN